jgi:ribosomal-protein-alanine N-acetyltransferase
MLALAEEARRAGAKSLTLEVRASNKNAQSLYTKFGMAPVGIRKRYYRDEDALIMWVHDIDRQEYEERLESIRAALGSELAS